MVLAEKLARYHHKINRWAKLLDGSVVLLGFKTENFYTARSHILIDEEEYFSQKEESLDPYKAGRKALENLYDPISKIKILD